MTLCLAWARRGEISLASDSRLTGPFGILSDIATKIFTVRVQVTSPDGQKIFFQDAYGLCFTGSYLNGSLIADSMGELLSSLTLPALHQISAETIATIAFGIYQDISSHLMALNQRGGLSEMWLAGHCPQQGRNRLFRFSWRYTDTGDGISLTMTEEKLADNTLLFLGDQNAINRARELAPRIRFENGRFANGYTEYHLLREIIDDPSIGGVGGAIQTGHLIGRTFRLFGMVDYEIDNLPGQEIKWVRPVYTFRGIPLVRAMENGSPVRIQTSKLSMAPFTEKQAALEAEAHRLNQQDSGSLPGSDGTIE